MGLFCVNLHFRTTDDGALSAALDRRGVTRNRVLPAQGGWTSLYEERASQQDDERIRELASGLSADLRVAVIAFLVHDSDIACYWLFDGGRMLDEYHSYPDYFDADASGDGSPSPSGGHPDVLLRYCRSGVQRDELAAILTQETLFAERLIEQLADALGIEPQRALADYRDVAGGGPGGFDGPGGGDDDDDDGTGGGPSILSAPTGLAGQLASLLGSAGRGGSADPRATALVEAAARDDMEAIDRLLADGVAIEADAALSLPGEQPLAGLGQLFPGGAPKIAMSPLLAAVVNKRRRAAERLLDGGADPNHVHPLFGTPLHAATGAGDADLLQLLLDRGGDRRARNVQGQTPLQVVAAGRATRERLGQAQAMMKSMGIKLPAPLDQLSNLPLPTAGWDACERLLESHAAR